MSNLGKLFILIGIMWLFQLWFAYKQSKIFQDDIRGLRKQGTMAVGLGGRRYRGGRAFVALTADDNGIVKDGLVLRGFTIFARSKQLSAYTGFSIKEIASGNRVAEYLLRYLRRRRARLGLREGKYPKLGEQMKPLSHRTLA